MSQISDFKKLKKGVVRLYKTYVLEEAVRNPSGQDASQASGNQLKGYKET